MASLLVAGSTGAIGRTVVQHAAKCEGITRVVALTRSTNTGRENYAALFGIHPITAMTEAHDGVISAAESTPLGKHEAALTEEQMNKIVPVTFDWSLFYENWAGLKELWRFSRLGQVKPETMPTAPGPTEERAGGEAATEGAETAERAAERAAKRAAEEAALNEERWRGVFAGHTYCVMALGTTRSDAGSDDSFIRCDYDYVIAFTEAVLHYSAPGGLPLNQKIAVSKRMKDRPVEDNLFFLHRAGDKTRAATPKGKSSSGNEKTITFLEALPHFKVAVPEGVSTGTLRRFCQVSSYNAKESSFLLYAKTKGAADAAVAERVLYSNELAIQKGLSELVKLSVIMPGLLERYEKSRGMEKFAKLLVSAIGVEKCGACAVANLIYDNRHFQNDPSNEEEDAFLLSSGGAAKAPRKRNKHAFNMGEYFDSALVRHQEEVNGNKLLYYCQGNKEIERQAERLVAEETG